MYSSVTFSVVLGFWMYAQTMEMLTLSVALAVKFVVS